MNSNSPLCPDCGAPVAIELRDGATGTCSVCGAELCVTERGDAAAYAYIDELMHIGIGSNQEDEQ